MMRHMMHADTLGNIQTNQVNSQLIPHEEVAELPTVQTCNII